jgi:hypothetical protein
MKLDKFSWMQYFDHGAYPDQMAFAISHTTYNDFPGNVLSLQMTVSTSTEIVLSILRVRVNYP